MSRAATTIFNNVSVGLPSKVRGSEAEEEWQEVDWVTWSTGELSVDVGSFLMVFRPSATVSKPLGKLARANTVGEGDDSLRTLVITSSDDMHGQYRFTFSDRRSTDEFKKLADGVEAARAAAASRGAESSGRCSGGPRAVKLAADIQEKYGSRWPHVFSDAELYGPEPSREGGQVLIGHGAVVLLDPEEDGKTGKYSLLFFSEDDGVSRPTLDIPIGPKMKLKRQQMEDADGPAAMFEFSVGSTGVVYEVSFDDAATGAMFSREFRVRSRLMDVSLKTATGQKDVSEARREIQELNRQKPCARLWRYTLVLLVLVLVVACVRIGLLHRVGKGPDEWVEQLTKDFEHVAHASQTFAKSAGSKVCEWAVGTVSTADLQKCLAVGGVSQVRECVEQLIHHAGA